MKVPMGPPPTPPPKNPTPSNSEMSSSIATEQINPETEPSESLKEKIAMGPPPPKNPNHHQTDTKLATESQINAPDETSEDQSTTGDAKPEGEFPTHKPPSSNSTSRESPSAAVPYTIPSWSEPPGRPFFVEVLKDGSIIDQFDVSEKGAYMFGRVELCDFVLEHPTISRFHAVLQFKKNADAYLYDLGSTHGTFINKSQVKPKLYVELHVGDVIRLGQSSRLYIFQGPSELMPPEGDLRSIRSSKIQDDMQDREASLLRARRQASLADGISWGMGEDAIEEAEEELDEVTWQTYKGQLTEKQEKTREKIIKRTEKIANMKKEIDAIRVKDIAQGGLTQGQQTQIARNEQRISQILEELENLEETLNESIRESLGARTGKSVHGKKNGAAEDEDGVLSDDDDDFYDRTKKPSIQKAGEHQSIETADTLLDKKAAIINEIEVKNKLLLDEKSKMVQVTEGGTECGDALDAYMTGLSSQLVLDRTVKIQKELSTLQSELDRIFYLLKIADPTGEAARKRELNLQASNSNQPGISTPSITKRPPLQQKKSSALEKPKNTSVTIEESGDATQEASEKPEDDKNVKEIVENKAPVYMAAKPRWLGATQEMEMKEIKQQDTKVNTQDSDQFIDYKDRKKVLEAIDDVPDKVESNIEGAAPGLIIRKRKQIEEPQGNNDKAPEQSMVLKVEAENMAADAVALLLKHTHGHLTADDGEGNENKDAQPRKEIVKSRRTLGPERPTFLDGTSEYESWVPPKGQSGDGRTSLNDRYGY